MTALVDRYLAALVKHDPAGPPLNRDVKFTENSARLPLGGGASNLQAAEIFKIDHGRITGIEAMGAQLPYGTKSGWGE